MSSKTNIEFEVYGELEFASRALNTESLEDAPSRLSSHF